MRTREGVCILLVKETEKGLKGFDGKSSRDHWKLVQGGREEKDRTYRETALRELEEETGLKEEDLLVLEKTDFENTFQFKGEEEIPPYRGIQKCFVAKMKGSREVSTNHEFKEHRFEKEEKMLEKIGHPNLKDVARKLWEEARKLE